MWGCAPRERTMTASSGTNADLEADLLEFSRTLAGVPEDVFPILYDDLRNAAAGLLSSQASDHTLQPTALVNEAYLRLQPRFSNTELNRPQLMALAARIMRTILIDHARTRNRQKRGGGLRRVTLTGQPMPDAPIVDALAMDEAMRDLAVKDARLATLVECRCFGGMTLEECAAALGVSRATVARDWTFARTWLQRRLRAAESCDEH